MRINTPTLIINKKIALRNIERMIQKADRNRVRFRPHFKTHQSIEVGRWFRKFDVKGITVSSVKMAECFATDGWKDITIAFPVNILEIEKINKLSKKIDLKLLVDSLEATSILEKKLTSPTKIWIDIDVGYHRDGILWNNKDKITNLATKILEAKNLELKGILTHAGHSYKARTKEEVLKIHKDSIKKMQFVQQMLKKRGFTSIEISVGDTPTASIAENFSAVNEIRPGNFVFYDLTQEQITSCSEEDIAIRFACPVVSKNRDRLELLIDGGAIHFSKDFIVEEDNKKVYGYLSSGNIREWGLKIKSTYISSLSQEHGILKTDAEQFEKISVGDVILIIPVHACLAVNIMKKCRLTTGKEFEAVCT